MQPLLERERELAQLRSLVDRVLVGDSALAVLEAPAGIGKTRLIGAARAIAAERALPVLAARGSERERAYPFGVVRQLLDPAVLTAPEDRRRVFFSGAGALAQSVFDRCSDEEPPDGTAYATLHGLYWLLVAVAGGGPLLVTVDDVHWADVASVRFLSFLARRIEGLGIALLVATRPREPTADDRAEAIDFAEDPGAEMIIPATLSETGVAQLAAEALGSTPAAAFSRACWKATGGNPFYLHALLGELVRDGVAPTEAEVARVGRLAPEAVLRSILVRLAILPSGALAVAQAVAVLGDGAALGHAAELAGLEVSAALDAAEALVRIGVLSDSEDLAFAHPIVRSALYRDLTASRRAQRHARAARLLTEAGASQDEIAAHLLFVAPGADPMALRTLQRAARRALVRGAPDVAVTYLRRALAEPVPQRDRTAILAELGSAEAHAGLPDCVAHLSAALQLPGEASNRVATGVTLARVLAASGRASESVALLAELADELAVQEPHLGAQVEAELRSLGDVELSVRGPTQRWRAARCAEPPDPEHPPSPGMLVHLAAETGRLGSSATETADLAGRALADGGLLVDALAGAQLFFLATSLLIFAEDFESAASFLDQALAKAVDHGSVLCFIGASSQRSLLNLRRGLLVEAEADARAAAEAAQSEHWPTWTLHTATVLASVLLERGDARSASAMIGDVEPEPRFATATMGTAFLEARGRVRIESGEIETGVADLLEAGRRFVGWGMVNPAAFAWRSTAGLGLIVLGRPARAAALVDEEVALARRWGSPRAIGVALRAHARVGGGREEAALLTAAAAVLQGSGAYLEHARALVDLGSALRRGRQRTAAREPLRAALQLAHWCGAAPLAERAHTELAATGARPRTPLRTGLDSLTPSELRIARMAEAGKSNPAIAQALFVTVKTVEMHLTSSFRKLSIGSRGELAAAMDAQRDADAAVVSFG